MPIYLKMLNQAWLSLILQENRSLITKQSQAIQGGVVRKYISDFPVTELLNNESVVFYSAPWS